LDLFPLARAQRRVYDLDRVVEGAAGLTASLVLRGALDEAAMQRALNLVLETNDALRLRVTPQALQHFTPHAPETFPVRHFESVEQLHAWADKEALAPVSMIGRLYEFMLFTAGDCFGLYMRFHHLVMDAWSIARLVSQLHTYYNAPQAAEPQPSYRDYVEKDETYPHSTRYARDKDYWLAQYRGWPNEGCFLAKQPARNPAAARWATFLQPEQAQPLRDFAQEHGLSIFSMLTTAMGIYLARLRGQKEVSIGTTILGRQNAAQRKTIGMFVNTLALPQRMEPAGGFVQHVKAFQETLYGAIRHESFSCTDLLGAMKEQNGIEGRLYDVLLNYQNAAVAGMDEALFGTFWHFCGQQPETLQIQVNDRDNTGGLFMDYDYNLATFNEREVMLLHQRLMTLLHDAISAPNKAVSQLELLCEDDRKAWESLNRAQHGVDLLPVHRFFEEQAALHPEANAVICGEQRLSYSQLNDWSNRIVGYLREKGIAPGQVVAIRMERRIELMPLLFGIMKAGSAYLPVLPAWPEARVEYILHDAKAAMFITENDLQNLHDLPAYKIESSADADLPAYVMYTSGSTGQPKGVRVGQAGLCNRLLWMESAYPLAPGETLIQKTSYAFDVSAWELFWPFMQGRALLLPEPGAEQDPRRLAELIAQHQIRTIHFVPSMLSLFLEYLNASGQKLPSLKRVVVSGEALTPALNRRFYNIFVETKTRLINLYGPTECTVDVLYYDCGPSDAEIPIGRPVWNTGAYVLNQDGMLLPPGETGELCITGLQLAHGYADPSLDENRFVQHPSLGRIYKTGDQCSLRADGQVLYHGREDGQIKIRGQRVELSEIEAQLEQAPGVTRAAICYEGAKLHGFVCANANFDESAALQFLSERLPAYMLPERVIAVPEFPLNANGKLDRRALMQLGVKNEGLGTRRDAAQPVTQREHQLMAIVRAHLKGGEVSMGDNPSRCGLSSLDIAGATLELEAQGLHLRVSDFYTATDFYALAALAEEGAERPTFIQLTGLDRAQRSSADADGGNGAPPQVACVGVPYGGGGFAAWADVARELEMPFYAVKTAHEDPDALLQIIKALPHERFVLLGSCVGAGLAIALAQRLDDAGRLAKLCVVASNPPPFVKLIGRWYKPWRMRSQSGVNRALQRLSERELRLGQQEIMQLRADAAWFLRYLATARLNLRAPVKLIYGSEDPALRPAGLRKSWERVLGRPIDMHVIAGGRHDIVHTRPKELAALIQKQGEESA